MDKNFTFHHLSPMQGKLAYPALWDPRNLYIYVYHPSWIRYKTKETPTIRIVMSRWNLCLTCLLLGGESLEQIIDRAVS